MHAFSFGCTKSVKIRPKSSWIRRPDQPMTDGPGLRCARLWEPARKGHEKLTRWANVELLRLKKLT